MKKGSFNTNDGRKDKMGSKVRKIIQNIESTNSECMFFFQSSLLSKYFPYFQKPQLLDISYQLLAFLRFSSFSLIFSLSPLEKKSSSSLLSFSPFFSFSLIFPYFSLPKPLTLLFPSYLNIASAPYFLLSLLFALQQLLLFHREKKIQMRSYLAIPRKHKQLNNFQPSFLPHHHSFTVVKKIQVILAADRNISYEVREEERKNQDCGSCVVGSEEETSGDWYELGPGLAQFEEKEYLFEKQNLKYCHQETAHEPYRIF